jgi:archaellum biogenesis protein FlaJ (TadC family)
MLVSCIETWNAIKKILKKIWIRCILADAVDYTLYRVFRCFTKNYDDNYAAIFAGYLLMGVVLVPIFVYLKRFDLIIFTCAHVFFVLRYMGAYYYKNKGWRSRWGRGKETPKQRKYRGWAIMTIFVVNLIIIPVTLVILRQLKIIS